MRIALVCRRYHPEIGGVETHVREIAERLAKKNDVEVFTLVSDKNQVGADSINGIPVHRIKSMKFSYSIEFPLYTFGLEIRKFRPDIVHAHNIHTAIPYFASTVDSHSKFIVTPHYQGNALTPFRRLLFAAFKPYLNRSLTEADKVVCVSPIEREMLENTFQVDKNKLTIIPNGVDSELLKIATRRNNGDGVLRILSVARFDLKQKKTDKLVKAFKILKSKIDAKLVLVGSGPDKQKILDLIDTLDLTRDIELKSNLTREELLQEYANASIFATASENEAFGIAVAEAIAAKLKVVVPNSTGLASYVKSGYALGIDIPVTPAKMAEAILNCTESRVKVNSFSGYTWDMVASELTQVYDQLMTTRNRKLVRI